MVVSRKRNRPSLSLAVNGQTIEEVQYHKYLGVTVSNDLSWHAHVDAMCFKARQLLGLVYRSFGFANSSCLTKIYQAVVRPSLEYCGTLWDPHLQHLRAKVERVQGFAAKIVSRRWAEHGLEVAADLGWPALSQRRVYQKLCLCHRILSGLSILDPSSLFSLHPAHPDVGSCGVERSLRCMNSYPLLQPFTRTNYHRASFCVSVVSLWNSLPDSIITLNSDTAFKRHLRSFLVL